MKCNGILPACLKKKKKEKDHVGDPDRIPFKPQLMGAEDEEVIMLLASLLYSHTKKGLLTSVCSHREE